MPGVLRTDTTLAVAGGKGSNVARSLAVLGHPALVVGMIGGRTGDQVAELAREEGLGATWTRIEGETRTCIVVVSADAGAATVINEFGPKVGADEWREFVASAVLATAAVKAVCIAGSLPPGVPSEYCGSLVARLRANGSRVYVDAQGDALTSAIAARPHAVKINGDEAGHVLGRRVDTLEDAERGACELRDRGVPEVVITLGSAGAALAHPDGTEVVVPPAVKALSAVGSGDAFLAGYIAAETEGVEPEDALRQGVAAGVANAISPWGGVFDRGEYLAALAAIDDGRARTLPHSRRTPLPTPSAAQLEAGNDEQPRS